MYNFDGSVERVVAGNHYRLVTPVQMVDVWAQVKIRWSRSYFTVLHVLFLFLTSRSMVTCDSWSDGPGQWWRVTPDDLPRSGQWWRVTPDQMVSMVTCDSWSDGPGQWWRVTHDQMVPVSPRVRWSRFRLVCRLYQWCLTGLSMAWWCAMLCTVYVCVYTYIFRIPWSLLKRVWDCLLFPCFCLKYFHKYDERRQ